MEIDNIRAALSKSASMLCTIKNPQDSITIYNLLRAKLAGLDTKNSHRLVENICSLAEQLDKRIYKMLSMTGNCLAQPVLNSFYRRTAAEVMAFVTLAIESLEQDPK